LSPLSGIKNSWKYEKDLIIYNRNKIEGAIALLGKTQRTKWVIDTWGIKIY